MFLCKCQLHLYLYYSFDVNRKIHFFLQDEKSNLLKGNSSNDEEAILCKDDQQCTGTLKKRVSRVSRKPNNRLPRIHEDYCGPRHHRPRHH